MPKIIKENYVLVTKSPGLTTINPNLDPGFKKELDAYEAGTLRQEHPGKEDFTHTPYNFHQDNQYMDKNKGWEGKIKDELIVKELCVPKLNDDGTPNVDGVIVLEKVDDVISLWNACLSMGNTAVRLDTRFGKDLTEKERERLRLPVKAETDDLMTRKAKKK